MDTQTEEEKAVKESLEQLRQRFPGRISAGKLMTALNDAYRSARDVYDRLARDQARADEKKAAAFVETARRSNEPLFAVASPAASRLRMYPRQEDNVATHDVLAALNADPFEPGPEQPEHGAPLNHELQIVLHSPVPECCAVLRISFNRLYAYFHPEDVKSVLHANYLSEDESSNLFDRLSEFIVPRSKLLAILDDGLAGALVPDLVELVFGYLVYDNPPKKKQKQKMAQIEEELRDEEPGSKRVKV